MNSTTTAITRVLSGHTSEATAFVVDDYPYGFRLRCKIRYWIESTPKKGQRLVSQTTNPKIAGREVWNKPKKSTYSTVMVMFLDGEDHVSHAALSGYDDEPRIDAFLATYGEALTGKDEQDAIKVLRAMARVQAKTTWVVRESKPGDPPAQTREEQNAMFRGAVGQELRRMG